MKVPKKSLGQHWLKDEPTLSYIANSANLSATDTVLEIGPGLGTLTRHLLDRAKEVMAVELDEALAQKLPSHEKLQVVQADILKFDLTKLPPGYKVVANIPYYLTSNLLRVLAESDNSPILMVLLVQKEVAQRITAKPGQMSVLAVSIQLYYQPQLGKVVPAELFTPSPKVDSQ
ncbi:MAG TPA: 16S rRNA (adenine(1518)-N(6)/adenine(1519)-N(6))-dimethyltransferase RsmA, partial [Candidatus Babeliales bacterium]|nr:16S rRNA (adenine(1518)-N(6)/adenine(1519)-N(6))-dimethyltransferase RsmA [Candidatus Babeliales bacterium]